MKFSKLFKRIIFLAVFGVWVEGALQGFYYVTAGDFLFKRVGLPMYAQEPYAGFGNRPGLSLDHRTNEFRARYFINHDGFRVSRSGLKYAKAHPADTYRIMLLGPSFAFGWGVDYEGSFAGVLEKLLQDRGFAGGKKIEIINAGIPAMPVAPQLVWLEHVGIAYTPDLVIQFVYGSMAISGSVERFANVDDKGHLVSISADPSWLRREWLKRSATVFYGWMLWAKFDEVRRPSHPGEIGHRVLGAGRELTTGFNFSPTHPNTLEAMQVYEKLGRVARTGGAQLLVVYFPLSYAIHREDESRWRHLGVHDVVGQMAFDTAFVQHLNRTSIPAIDLTQRLQKSAEGGQRLYFWLDIHWTLAGNLAAALAVADDLNRIAGESLGQGPGSSP